MSVQEQQLLSDAIAPRRFEYADDKSYKFWTIALNGPFVTTRFGRIGTQGQSREISYDSLGAAKADYAKRIQQKVKSGYEERVPLRPKVVTTDEDWQRLQDHEPFLQAILDDPEEIAGYAIYADWLVERDDPQGEFMQLQLALENPMLPLFKRPKIQNAARLLRQTHARRWLGNLAPWLMDYGIASYPYEFFRGQLSSIACHVLSLRFAHELRRSPHCRMLREFSIETAEVLKESAEIEGRRFEPDTDYGVETLIGANFSNLREFRVGMLPDTTMAQRMFTNTCYLLELIESMPRIETLYLMAEVDHPRLIQLELPKLTSLHLAMRPNWLPAFLQSNIVSRLRTFGLLTPLTTEMVDALVRDRGFNQLSEFTCSQLSRISDEDVRRLNSTGVVINVLNYPPED